MQTNTSSKLLLIKQHWSILAILLLSAFLNLYRLNLAGRNGLGNTYYAAAIQSMSTSWRNFFYLSFDPAGFVSLDKPPLAFWIQAFMAKIFGFSGLPMLLPQAVAGVMTVYIVYRLVRHPFGEYAALTASLALTVMPVSVVIQRNNAPDALMVFVLTLAAWMLIHAMDKASLRYLFGTGALVGIAFNIKMLQILLVIPAFVVLYLWAAPWRLWKRLLYGLGSATIAVLVAVPWVLAVDLTPPELRPYVGGSANNTVTDLIFNYNGLARLWGEDFTFYSGQPGVLCLFNERLGGQMGWILPLALLGAGVATWQLCRNPSPEQKPHRNALILWLVWIIPGLVYFGISTFFHRYYLATIAPGVAALFGVGAQAFWKLWQQSNRMGQIFVLAAFLVCVGTQIALLWPFPGWSNRLIPLIGGAALFGLAGLFVSQRWGAKFRATAFTFCLFILLIAPLTWTLIPIYTCTNETLPYAGPQVLSPDGVCKLVQHDYFLEPEWLAVFEQGRDGARYMAATHDMGIAIFGMLDTKEPFMALGGFRGSDPILTADQFAELVARGEVRYYTALKDEAEYPIQEGIRQWVKDHCPLALSAEQGIAIWGPCEVSE